MNNPYEGYVRKGSTVTVKFRSRRFLEVEVAKVKDYEKDFWVFRNDIGQELIAHDFEYMEVIRF